MTERNGARAVNGIEADPVEGEVNAEFGDTIIMTDFNNTPKQGFG